MDSFVSSFEHEFEGTTWFSTQITLAFTTFQCVLMILSKSALAFNADLSIGSGSGTQSGLGVRLR
jgi:hypothetical protein